MNTTADVAKVEFFQVIQGTFIVSLYWMAEIENESFHIFLHEMDYPLKMHFLQ